MQRTMTEVVEKDKKLPPLMGRNTCCCGPTNCLRLLCQKIAMSVVFNGVILGLIGISTVTLALETPLDDPMSNKVRVIDKIDILLTVCFSLEIVFKIIAFGIDNLA